MYAFSLVQALQPLMLPEPFGSVSDQNPMSTTKLRFV